MTRNKKKKKKKEKKKNRRFINFDLTTYKN